MRHYTFAFLRDYFSARGLTLTRREKGAGCRYTLTNGVWLEHFANLQDVTERATTGLRGPRIRTRDGKRY